MTIINDSNNGNDHNNDNDTNKNIKNNKNNNNNANITSEGPRAYLINEQHVTALILTFLDKNIVFLNK